MIRRPDTSTIINTGDRLVLNGQGVRAIATLADERGIAALDGRSTQSDHVAQYLAGVADALKWLAGDRPDESLQRWLGIEP
jgi:hypothetical protein